MPDSGSKAGTMNTVASWIFGGAVLAVIVAVVFVLPEPTEAQRVLIRFLMALSAAFLSYFFLGRVLLKGKVFGQAIGGSGGFALFIIIQFFADPYSARTIVADVAPALLPKDESVAAAQTALKDAGLYDGTVTGVADTKTREAIKTWQTRNKVRADGYVAGLTRRQLQSR